MGGYADTQGLFTWQQGNFRAGASSLGFPLMALYLFTWYHHKMSCQCESHQREFIPIVVQEQEFHPSTKFYNSIMYTWNNHSFRCEISLQVDWSG